MSPDVAAVSADPIEFVGTDLVRLAVSGMAFRAGEIRALYVNRVREPYIRRLLGIHKPRSFMPRLDVVVDKNCLCLAVPNLVGVARRAFLHRWKSGEGAVIANRVALTAVRDSGFLGVRLVQKFDRLIFLHIKHPRKYDPSQNQGDEDANSKRDRVAANSHFSTVQSVFVKKCWNRHTRSGRDRNCATPRTGIPPSQPGACRSWISSVSLSRSSSCHAVACCPEINPARVRPGTSHPSKSHPAP